MNDNQVIDMVFHPDTAPIRAGSIQEVVGCMCKKQLHGILRPHVGYNSRTIDQFFTDELLSRCGLTRVEMKRMRVFPVEVNFIVVTHLKTNRLI